MPRLSILSLVLTVLFAVSVQQIVASNQADADFVATVDAQLQAVPSITRECSPDSAVAWLDVVGEILTRVGSGGLPGLPPSTKLTVQTLATQIVASKEHSVDDRVVAKTVELLPSLWSAGFFYATPETWQPVLSSVTTPLTEICKTKKTSYSSLVNATSLMVRFTKDNVFLDGVDNGDAIANAAHRGFVAWLAQLVASVSKLDGFTLTEAQLRAYMKTLPSKRDGMDTAAAFPTFVDTAKYKTSDATALRNFLATPSTKQSSATTQ